MEQEHENIYALMMDALDDSLAEPDKQELEAHLHICSDCLREWHALVAVETLLRNTPALAPAADFTQRTLARLPNRRYRVWAISTIYVLLLLCGIVPMLLGVWAFFRLVPVLNQPALFEGIQQSIQTTMQLVGTVLGALFNGLGEIVTQQPATLGWLLVIVGVISLWGGVLRELLTQPRPAQAEQIV
ncbi:MAG: anti-sigma factor [Chloroflexota bacterium]